MFKKIKLILIIIYDKSKFISIFSLKHIISEIKKHLDSGAYMAEKEGFEPSRRFPSLRP